MRLKSMIGWMSVSASLLLAAGYSHDKPANSAMKSEPTTSVAERPGMISMKGKPLTLTGVMTPKVGDTAPAFTAVANDMSTFSFEHGDGVTIISAVPSLDTSVCSTETKRFNQEAERIGSTVRVLTISMDLPFAQKRWCGAENVKNVQTISDARDRSFADAYGLRIKENGLLARAVFVVGKDGKIAYEQIVPEVASEPEYGPVLDAAKAAK